MTDFYTASADPANDSDIDSSVIRAEFAAVAEADAKLARYTGNGGKIVAINAGGTAHEPITTTGTGSGVRATSPTLVAPVLGAAEATSINKLTLTQPATEATLTIADGKTLSITHTLTLAGTDGTTMTFPATSATLARSAISIGSVTLNGADGVTVTHNKGDTNYLLKLLPTGAAPGDVGEVSYVKAANTATIYNTGRPRLPADYELSATT